MVSMDKIVSLCKRRGFIYPSSEIYGGIAGFWDYGPLGVELKNNLKSEWWKSMVYEREDVVGLDAAIVMNPKVWEASGHVSGFVDPLVECKNCHNRFRADKIVDSTCPNCGQKGKFTEPKKFNLLTEVLLGVTEPKQKAYLRGEITQGVFVNFQNVVSSSRVKIPFGVAQIGKAFRNEITPGNFTYRSREFEQMELEYFIKPDAKVADKTFNDWREQRINWYKSLGIKSENLRLRKHKDDEKAHYAKEAYDIEYKAPFGWSEFEGIHNRGDWDLGRHNLKYKDQESGQEYTPWVIETSGGVDRATLFFLLDAYQEEDKRIFLKLHPKLAPFKAAVFPLVSNKTELVDKAMKVYKLLKTDFFTAWDDRGNIGKRYFAQDEIGTPFCVTIDYISLEDGTVTVRDRDTTKQVRISIDKLKKYISEMISYETR
ncbi:glycine--tRNA ligase [Candidatus Roizmanbacteria bacterium RIFCSPLOWO2_01_FULL_37_12]|uniref:glycine--tRNA ligase n=1 Tax=Candidatus Roizmanbacteria bacterium RIFCSPLOWO2_01_FULL_37_12 TaxID=1802056 RepID=A0A1F7I827_9BACT|nr:MAG: glycine--tRNA ligase [Candidatus Roizmanbacteria bacterium RIFCSPHIGHO2_02_FULL_37_9b]OGK39528.1 MAG: glycine--tRNA ligase [Candidatus Roizmanbacteria bacterium RIFCSPLOWO2_01_FULL_37_12]